ncbi:hypothetical protein BGX21_003598, partial [Mortierella sp. AD011]
MKPQFGKSKLTILKHAPTVHRKRRPIELRHKQENGNDLNMSAGVGHGGRNIDSVSVLHRTAGPVHGHSHGPPSLLRRQTTRHKSFMQLDLPSMRALRREPSMMELDPPMTLFTPAPTPSQFIPGPWAFFQAAEAQREQRQAQMEFLTRIQELRVRDEQLFVRMMASFAKECPVQFGQLTGFMRRMEMEMEMGVGPHMGSATPLALQQQLYQQQYQQQYQQYFFQNQSQRQPVGDLCASQVNSREYNGTKLGLLALAQEFGNQVQVKFNH